VMNYHLTRIVGVEKAATIQENVFKF
jgi:hypothetical protein